MCRNYQETVNQPHSVRSIHRKKLGSLFFFRRSGGNAQSLTRGLCSSHFFLSCRQISLTDRRQSKQMLMPIVTFDWR